MNETYQLQTISSVQGDEQAILHVLEQMHRGKLSNDLRLLNYYQEIPVSYPGTIEAVEDGMLDLTVHQNQAVVMQYQKITFLKSSHFEHDVVAQVFRAQPDKDMVLLHHFAYAQIRAERRQFVRVQIADDIPVSFSASIGTLQGRLVDISIRGASIDCLQTGPPVESQMEGELSLSLGGTVTIRATVLKVIPQEAGGRYIFCLEPDGKVEEKISQFIFQRQLEIIRALKDAL